MRNNFSIVIVEDEAPARALLGMFVQKTPQIELINSFSSANQADDFLSKNDVDILVLDIEMMGMTGLELAAKLNNKTKLIFATAFEKYALKGFELSAVDYLLKPYAFDRFELAIKKAIDLIQLDEIRTFQSESIVVKVNYTNRTIMLNEIHYLESINNTICIHLMDGEKIKFRESLKHFENVLPQSQFLRIHRSYIISRNKILACNGHRIVLKGIELPISQPFRLLFEEWYMNK